MHAFELKKWEVNIYQKLYTHIIESATYFTKSTTFLKKFTEGSSLPDNNRPEINDVEENPYKNCK